MAREDLHFRLRIPEALKVKIEAAAEENRRSMTAEIIARLEESFQTKAAAGTISKEDLGQAVQDALSKSLADVLSRAGIERKLSEHAGQTFIVNVPDKEDEGSDDD